jgi:hypothetical protein
MGGAFFPEVYSLRKVDHSGLEKADQVHSGDNASKPDGS